MKKLLMSALAIGAAIITNAQDGQTFRKFRVDIATGYAIQSSSAYSKGGFLFSIEPKLALNDNLSVGVRVEGEGDDVDTRISYLATGDYYFNTNQLRPFVGVGVGMFKSDAASSYNEYSSKVGFTPRAGIEFGHRRLAVEYNVAGKTGVYNNNYLGIKLGFFIGGGRLED
jgi:hypothetical protein